MFSVTEFYPSMYEVKMAGVTFTQEMEKYTTSILLPTEDPCSMSIETAIHCAAARVWEKAREFQYTKMEEQSKRRERYMGELKVFENKEFGQVRVVEVNGEPWFVGKDVCEKLGYANASKALSDHVDDEDKLNNESLLSLGQRGGWIINESGLYSLVLSSKLPTAKKFKHWVTSEVIPSIRKHGVYMTPDKLEEVLLNPDTLIKLATELKNEREQRIEAQKQVEAQKPAVIFTQAVSASQTSILVGDLAKILKQNGINMGQNRLFEWMRNNGYLMKQGSSKNMPTQKSMDMGLFEVKESSVANPDGSIRITRTTKVTGKGQVYFVNKLQEVKSVCLS